MELSQNTPGWWQGPRRPAQAGCHIGNLLGDLRYRILETREGLKVKTTELIFPGYYILGIFQGQDSSAIEIWASAPPGRMSPWQLKDMRMLVKN